MKERIDIINGHIKIPALVWGKKSDKVIIAAHGNLSHKEDAAISMLATQALEEGYQVISFDLPEHGDRAKGAYGCNPINAISDLKAVYDFAKKNASKISFFGCSLGAYFGLLAYKDREIEKSIFLSPVVNMEKIILGMMDGFGVTENRLELEKQIELPIGQVLDWDYYTYVKSNPIDFKWPVPTWILYGKQDSLTCLEDMKAFSDYNKCTLEIDQDGEHFYHTDAQMDYYRKWLKGVFA
jgi:pimeloyl-ACP methyl ester carboxylesterase